MTCPSRPIPRGCRQRATTAHPLSFTGIELALENPRTGDKLEWLPDRRHPGDDYHVIVATNTSSYDGGEIFFGETMQLADPSMTPWWVVIEFASPQVLPDISLPTQYILDDWSTATLHLAELSYFDGLSAQIYSLTPLAAPTLPGDYDGDGAVTSADYVVWRDMLGQVATGLAADGNADGIVNQTDYSVWRAYFGTTEVNTSGTASAVTANTIPEPGTVVMLLFVALPRFWRLRRPTRNGLSAAMRSHPSISQCTSKTEPIAPRPKLVAADVLT